MSGLADVSYQKGSWGTLIAPITQNEIKTDPKKHGIINKVARFAIGTFIVALLAGGIAVYFTMNKIAGLSLMGGAALLTIVDGIRACVVHSRSQKQELSHPENLSIDTGPDNIPSDRVKTPDDLANMSNENRIGYYVVSWNVGADKDYGNMCSLKDSIDKGASLSVAYNKLQTDNTIYRLNTDEKIARINLFQDHFRQFGRPDIVCLQESGEITPKTLREILPEGYTHFSFSKFANRGGQCLIAWDPNKFSKIDHANVDYDEDYINHHNRNPDTIVLLKDLTNGTTLCVGSAYLRGFSLNYNNFEATEQTIELEKAKAGNNQARYDLETMKEVPADLYVFAGDFNATTAHFPARFDIMHEFGYMNDANDTEPTIYDSNLKESDGTPIQAKLDHIFVKGTDVQIKNIPLEVTPLHNFNRPSDHLPVAARIILRV